MSNQFRKGQQVKWQWASGTAKGKVEDKFDRRVQRTLKGSKIVKNGTADNPAYVVVQDDGDKVLKRGSELSAG